MVLTCVSYDSVGTIGRAWRRIDCFCAWAAHSIALQRLSELEKCSWKIRDLMLSL